MQRQIGRRFDGYADSRHDEDVVEALNGGTRKCRRIDFGLRGNDWAHYSVKLKMRLRQGQGRDAEAVTVWQFRKGTATRHEADRLA